MILLPHIGFITPASKRFMSQNKRLLLPLFILACLAFPHLREITITALSDAFFQVSVFVAATLLIYYYAIEHLPQLELSYLSAKSPILEISFAAVLGAWAVMTFQPILPYALSFAAGAMIFVVVEEVIPETQQDKYTDIATMGFIGGFIIMMTLDVGLG